MNFASHIEGHAFVANLKPLDDILNINSLDSMHYRLRDTCIHDSLGDIAPIKITRVTVEYIAPHKRRKLRLQNQLLTSQ